MLADNELSDLLKSLEHTSTIKASPSSSNGKSESTRPLSTTEFIQAELDALLESSRPKPTKTEASLYEPLTAPTSSVVTADNADDQQLMRDILTQMKELTDEVKMFRERLDTGSNTQSDVLSTKPPGANISETYELPKEPDEPPSHAIDSSPPAKKKKNKAATVISNLLFYFVVIALVFGAFCIKSSKNGKPWSIAGYSAMTVLTGSMQDVYPQGSLIITKTVDADKLNIGDDITFMTGETSSITHRIIGITENYLETGERGFETKGIMNKNADKDIVAAGNVVGRVVFCSYALGKTAKFITTYWQLLLFFVLVLVALIAFLQWNARRTEKEDEQPKKQPKSHKK